MTRTAVDTSALLALMSPRDQWHLPAVAVARAHLARGGRWVGSVLVLAELHGHLLRRREPFVAHSLVERIRMDRAYEWLEVDSELLGVAQSRWLTRFPSKSVSLADAVTFEIMRRERIGEVFAFDDDFVLAGYRLQQ